MRVVFLRRALLSQLGGEALHDQRLPASYHLKMWARRHGYTPIDSDMSRSVIAPTCLTDVSTTMLSSLSCSDVILDVCRVLDESKQCLGVYENTDETCINIVDSDSEEAGEASSKPAPPECMTSPFKHLYKDKQYLPLSEQQLHVQDTAAQVGVLLKPVELLNESTEVILGSVTESVIWKCAELFMDSLLRKSLSHAAISERASDAIGTEDVFDAVVATPRFDFLSNSYLETKEHLDTTSDDRAAPS